MTRIGCLGISANPPHLGHREIAEILLYSGLVDEIWIIPTFDHPFGKEGIVPWEHRVNMCRFLESDRDRIRVSLAEAELTEVEKYKGMRNYTINTLEYLRKNFPNNSFVWCLGSDIVVDGSYSRWHNWEKLEREDEILVVERVGYPLSRDLLSEPFVYAGQAYRDISSTDIRNLIHEGKSLADYTGIKIANYIRKNRLYEPKGG